MNHFFYFINFWNKGGENDIMRLGTWVVGALRHVKLTALN